MKTEKGKIGTLQGNKTPDSNILKCKNLFLKIGTNNGGSNIPDVKDLMKKENSSRGNMNKLMKNSLMMKQLATLINDNN